MATKADSRNLTRKQLIDFLTKAGCRRPKAEIETIIRRMIAEGAPVNPDGTIHFLKLVAFMEGRRNGKF